MYRDVLERTCHGEVSPPVVFVWTAGGEFLKRILYERRMEKV